MLAAKDFYEDPEAFQNATTFRCIKMFPENYLFLLIRLISFLSSLNVTLLY